MLFHHAVYDSRDPPEDEDKELDYTDYFESPLTFAE